jgi:argininosuccinate lyase
MFFGNLDLATLKEFSPLFSEDVFNFILPQASVEHKRSAGSTNPHEVKKQIVHWTRTLGKRRL